LQQSSHDASLTVVGIGASAGGIEAFRSFFEAMPGDSGMALLVVLHSSAGHKSLLPEILSRWTPMPVREARDGETVEANTVLVIPPGYLSRFEDGQIRLDLPLQDDGRILNPIDVLFDSMARSLGDHAIGVILSGTGHDGALGLKAIKMSGGLTLAQGTDGTAPQYSGMPESAVALDAVDLQVPVDKIPAHILAARDTREAQGRDREDSVRVQRTRLAICAIIRSRLAHDFSQYKEQTFMRRVQRRMQVLKLTGLDAYIARLEEDREQVVLLFRDLLISVTSFFRDKETFDTLARDIIPRLFKGKDATGTVRIWVPGCATGEEAYSLAILIREHMDTVTNPPKVQIFASDIDEQAISSARAGRYPSTLLDGLSPGRRARFFSRGDSAYSVSREIRELCTFSAHSLIRDPPFSRMDMISCRNLLIYLDSNLQSTVIPIFHYSLVPDGILLLGISETISRHDTLFEPLDRAHRFFTRRDVPSEAPRMPYIASREPITALRASDGDTDPKSHWRRAIGLAGQRVLERFASAYVVVTEGGDIAHYSTNTSKYLEMPAGTPTTNLFEMARRSWNLEIRNALRRCIETGRSVEQDRSLPDTDADGATTVRLVVEPLAVAAATPLYLVIFVETGKSGRPVRTPLDIPPAEDAGLVSQLEDDIRVLREQLQSVTEEYGTALEELRSSNEELQSVNEELQSTNEELETSKEEIQSINEELNTVNAELVRKIEELDKTSSDLRNLFDSTKVATVFLDSFMIIRSFTPEIAKIYSLIPTDQGRPLTDIVHNLDYHDLRTDVRHVLRTMEPLERRVARSDGSAHYLMRILPYRTPESAIDGSLVTFVDVTSIVRAEEHQRLLIDELNHRVKNMLTVVISLATHTLRRSTSLTDFGSIFLGRIHALTAAYELVTRDGWSNVPLRAVLVEELKPFMTPDGVNIILEGPDVMIEPRGALALGMAVHELTTNAAKYGALSVAEGTVSVQWSIEKRDDGEYLRLHWAEDYGPTISLPVRRGFGMMLIERGLAHDLAGEMTVDFAPGGVRANLSAPLRIRPELLNAHHTTDDE
jgi:two-component system CheB/CheR fusion protein